MHVFRSQRILRRSLLAVIAYWQGAQGALPFDAGVNQRLVLPAAYQLRNMS